ncbi:unnamed protein product, partial [Symbiodinium necroappetens]
SHAASQEPAGQTGLGVPPLPGSLQGLPLTSTSGVHGYLEATLRHQPLLGTAGYPTGVPPASFPWGQVPMSLLPAGLPAGVARAAAREDVSLARSPDRGAIGRLPPSAPTPCTAAPEPKALARAAVTVHSVPEGTRGAGAAKAEEVERKPRSAFKLSQLEEMFKSSAYINNVYCIAKDQAGCRMLQHKLDEGGPDVFAAVFSEVVTHAVELMMDPFGNYLCQKLMEMSSARQLEVLVDKTYGSLVNISLNMHGARAVQKLIDVVRMVPVCMTRLVGALEFAVVTLTKDPNGNHVVQRCLESLPSDAHGFIFRAVAKDIEDVASHRHGCRIVQRCIDAAKGSDRTMLIGAICRASLTLIQDPFGNYVVQYVLGLQDPQASSLIVTAMTGRLNVLSRQKFSSNVVERCLQLASPEDRARMITELADPRGLGDLLRDIYGNYVVQSALNIAVEPQISAVLAAVRPLLPSLRSSGQGRRIAQKLEKKFPQLRERGPNSEGPSRTGLAAIPQAAGGAGGGGVAAPWPPAAQGGLDAPGFVFVCSGGGAYLVPGAVTPGILNAAGLGLDHFSEVCGLPAFKVGRVALYYYTGWDQCQLHGCPKGESTWRDFPFKDVPGKPSVKQLQIEADGIEFVICDLKKQSWDNPPDWYGKKNYLIAESGQYSLRHGHLRRIRESKVMVVTDLDHTLVGHERDPENKLLEEFRNLWLGEYALNGSALAYSTGRSKSMALDVAQERQLIRPDLLICGVGTEVYTVPSRLPILGWWEERDSLELMPEWKSKMLNGFNRATVEELLTSRFQKFELRGTPVDDPYRIPTAYQMDEAFDDSKKLLQEALGSSYQVISSGHGEWKLIDICSAE